MEKVYDKSLAFAKWFLIVLFALMVAFQLTGCNTVRGAANLVKGFGTDVEEWADGIQNQLAKNNPSE